MEIEVKEASQRLGVSDSRVRKMLRDGSLRGRRIGTSWLVLVDDVARLESHRRRPGRPLAPRRAWAVLDLLDSGRAPWLPDSARSQVRTHLERLEHPAPEIWLSLLRNRSHVFRARAHPAALERLRAIEEVAWAGAPEASRRGFDLVVLGDDAPEFYVEASAWPQIARSLAIRESDTESNLVVRVPRDVWPFVDAASVSDAALAADLLESGEPRSVSAAADRLNELLGGWQEDRAHRAARREARRLARKDVREDARQR